jgi:hypothetical protein
LSSSNKVDLLCPSGSCSKQVIRGD